MFPMQLRPASLCLRASRLHDVARSRAFNNQRRQVSDRLQAHFAGGEQTLPPVPSSARLSDRVVVALGMNPSSFSLQGTNTYIVGTGPRRILIDAGDRDTAVDYLPVLRRALDLSGAEGIEQLVVTHWHRDHIGGVRSVLDAFGADIPIRKLMPADGAEAAWSGEGAVCPKEALEGCFVDPIEDGDVLRTQGATLRVLHTPGHANDHIALFLEEEGAMFTGDNVLGTGTPVFRDLPLYLRSLQKMHARSPGVLYTGHGPLVQDGVAMIEEYIAHRRARVDQVRGWLASDRDSLTADEIARGIYTRIPEHLMPAATGNTLQALRVLQEDGEVVCDLSEPLGANPHTSSSEAAPAQLLAARWRTSAA